MFQESSTDVGSTLVVRLIGAAFVVQSGALTTATLNSHVVPFPEISPAVYITVVTPNGNDEPGVNDELNEIRPQLSVAVGSVQLATPNPLTAAAVSYTHLTLPTTYSV